MAKVAYETEKASSGINSEASVALKAVYDEKTAKKKLRNIIYIVSGIIIFICVVLQAIYVVNLLKIPESVPFTMINEIVMLFAFGGAYLIKSEALKCFND